MFTALILGRCERIDTSKVRMHAGRERDAQHFLPPRHKPLDGCKIYNCLSAEDELPGSLTLFFPHAASRSPCSVWVHGKTLAYFAACRRPIKSKRHVPDLHRASFWFFCPDSVCVWGGFFPPFPLSAALRGEIQWRRRADSLLTVCGVCYLASVSQWENFRELGLLCVVMNFIAVGAAAA